MTCLLQYSKILRKESYLLQNINYNYRYIQQKLSNNMLFPNYFCPQSQSLNIAEASILFYSHHYKHLKCKIIQKSTSAVICSKLINNCIETIFNINHDLEDFIIQLYQDSLLVGTFQFSYEDLDRVIGGNDIKDTAKQTPSSIANCSINKKMEQKIHGKRKKYIKFKKQNDCCSLYFTIETKDLIRAQENDNQDILFLYQQYIRSLANKVYKKLQKRAINRIKRIQSIKLSDKRLSLLTNVNINCIANMALSMVNHADSVQSDCNTNKSDNLFKNAGKNKNSVPKMDELEIIKQQRTSNKKYTLPDQIQTKKIRQLYMNKQIFMNHLNPQSSQDKNLARKLQQFSCSWTALQSIANPSKLYKQRKNQYKLLKMRERVKRMFRNQIQKSNILSNNKVIIPETKKIKLKNGKIDQDSVQLLSEGIIFPTRITSENVDQIQNDAGVKIQPILQIHLQQYAKYSNFSSQIFESQFITPKIQDSESKSTEFNHNPNGALSSKKIPIDSRLNQSCTIKRKQKKLPTTIIHGSYCNQSKSKNQNQSKASSVFQITLNKNKNTQVNTIEGRGKPVDFPERSRKFKSQPIKDNTKENKNRIIIKTDTDQQQNIALKCNKFLSGSQSLRTCPIGSSINPNHPKLLRSNNSKISHQKKPVSSKTTSGCIDNEMIKFRDVVKFR